MVPKRDPRQAHSLHEAEAPHRRAPRLLVIKFSDNGCFHESKCRTTQGLLSSPGYALICTGISLSSPLSSNALCFFACLLLQTEDEDCLYHYYCLLAQLCARAKCDSQLEYVYRMVCNPHAKTWYRVGRTECKCGTKKHEASGKESVLCSEVRYRRFVHRSWCVGYGWRGCGGLCRRRQLDWGLDIDRFRLGACRR